MWLMCRPVFLCRLNVLWSSSCRHLVVILLLFCFYFVFILFLFCFYFVFFLFFFVFFCFFFVFFCFFLKHSVFPQCFFLMSLAVVFFLFFFKSRSLGGSSKKMQKMLISFLFSRKNVKYLMSAKINEKYQNFLFLNCFLFFKTCPRRRKFPFSSCFLEPL